MPLENRVRDAVTIMENLFKYLDADSSGTISFDQLARKLASRGFHDTEKLQQVFGKVDKNRTGTIGFPEFLMLMYLWNDVGPQAYQIMLGDPTPADAVNRGFSYMEQAYIRYDLDKTRVLNHDEFHKFMGEQLNEVFQRPESQRAIAANFPPSKPHLRFHEFLYVVYLILVPHASLTAGERDPAPSGVSGWHQSLLQCFTAMENDFSRFDQDGDGCIDLAELTKAFSGSRPSSELVEVLGRLEYYFQQVDLDGSNSLSFNEFMYLMYLMVKEGAYKDIIQNPQDAAAVKKNLLHLESSYIKYDVSKTRRLDIHEVSNFVRDSFGSVDPSVPVIFDRLKTSVERPHIDLARFMRLLYEVLMPRGRYTEGRVQPKPAAAAANPLIQTYTAAPPPKAEGRHRVSTLVPSEVTKDKQIGQGGFGAVYLGKFRGMTVAAKYLLETASPELCAETEKEVAVMAMFDHPNIVFLIGACTKMPEVCIVTEFCSNGSLFDCMHKRRVQFDMPSLWRITRECAVGLNVLHEAKPVAVIHRDIKSLNILLDENYTVKICDFGLSKIMSKGSMMMTRGLGTPHWMAPEVISSSHYSTPSDVYSFGVLLWELFHRQIPYGNMDAAQIAMGVVSKQMRPPISSRVPPTMGRFMEWCWQQDPKKRPLFTQVIQALDSVKAEFVK